MALAEREHQSIVRRAIARAQKEAPERTPEGNRRFVSALRTAYFAEHRRARSGAGDVSQHIFQDPRFLENARLLSEKTARQLRVMGGSVVRGHAFDDCVAVGNDHQWGCTGTLISANLVVTAGHCADFATRIFIGNDVARRGKQVLVKKRIRHPKYHRGGRHNDLLLLLLAAPVPDTHPRRIARTALIDHAPDGRVVGFGNTDPSGTFGYGIKRQTDVPIASPLCRGKVDGQEDAVAYGCDVGLEVVAGKPLLAHDSCNGDSGGPFYVEDDEGRWFLAGATSRATDSATHNCGDGGIYVRIDKYRDWIQTAGGVKLP